MSRTWTEIATPDGTLADWTGVAYGAGLYVAVNDGLDPDYDPTTIYATSPDGCNWTQRNFPVAAGWLDIIWTGTFFSAVGSDGETATSPDGITWTMGDTLGFAGVSGLAWNGNVVIIHGVSGEGGGVPWNVWTSTDGLTWDDRATLIAGVATEFSFGCAIGPSNAIVVMTTVSSSASTGALISTDDGVTWTYNEVDAIGDIEWQAVIWNGTNYIAVSRYMSGFSPSNIAATSPDGVTWTLRTMPSSGAWSKLLRLSTDEVVAVATTGEVAYSTDDGVTWSPDSTSSSVWSCGVIGPADDILLLSYSGGAAAATFSGTFIPPPSDTVDEGIMSRMQMLQGNRLIELFTVDGTGIGADVARFHQHTQSGIIFWQGNEFYPWPIQSDGFAKDTEQPPTPKLSIANLDGTITELCRQFDDMVGAIITRQRTFAQYLDAENWPDSSLPGPTGGGSASGTGWGNLGMIGAYTGISRVAADAGYARLDIEPLLPGITYRIGFEVTGFSGDSTYVVFAPDTVAAYEITANGLHSFEYTPPTGTAPYIQFGSVFGAGDCEVDFFTLAIAGAGNANADPTQEFPPEIWYVERKSNETREAVVFELVTALDLNGVKLPRRQIIANYCSSLSNGGYRGATCGYTGPAVAKADDTPTSDMDLDRCGGKLSSCKLREWPGAVLGFGGFPAAGLIR